MNKLNEIRELNESILSDINSVLTNHLGNIDEETLDSCLTALGIVEESVNVLCTQIIDLEGALTDCEGSDGFETANGNSVILRHDIDSVVGRVNFMDVEVDETNN